jgi:hypothetical protein
LRVLAPPVSGFAPPLDGAGIAGPAYPGFRHPCGVPSPGATAQRPLRGSRPDQERRPPAANNKQNPYCALIPNGVGPTPVVSSVSRSPPFGAPVPIRSVAHRQPTSKGPFGAPVPIRRLPASTPNGGGPSRRAAPHKGPGPAPSYSQKSCGTVPQGRIPRTPPP